MGINDAKFVDESQKLGELTKKTALKNEIRNTIVDTQRNSYTVTAPSMDLADWAD